MGRQGKVDSVKKIQLEESQQSRKVSLSLDQQSNVLQVR